MVSKLCRHALARISRPCCRALPSAPRLSSFPCWRAFSTDGGGGGRIPEKAWQVATSRVQEYEQLATKDLAGMTQKEMTQLAQRMSQLEELVGQVRRVEKLRAELAGTLSLLEECEKAPEGARDEELRELCGTEKQ
eukprot:g64876.t1